MLLKRLSLQICGLSLFAGCWQLARVGLSNVSFIRLRGPSCADGARPLSRSLWDWGCHTLDFIRLRGSILRRRRGPSLGAYGLGVFHIGFQDATRIHPAPMARPLSRGLRFFGGLTLAFRMLRGSILHRWCGSPLRAYGIWSGSYWLSYCYV